MNIAAAVDRHATHRPHAPALFWEEQWWSWARLAAEVDCCARGLLQLGVGVGDRVCLFLHNGPAFVLAHLACQKVGAVCVSIAASCKVGEVAYRLCDCRGRLLITEASLCGELPPRCAVPQVHTVVGVDALDADCSWAALLAGTGERVEPVDLPADAPVSIIYTSGTTGEPKGVVLTHGNVAFNSQAVAAVTGLQANDRVVCFLPLYHSFAQNFILNAAVHAGAAVVLQAQFDQQATPAAIHRHQVTRLCGVPPVYNRLLAVASDAALASVRHCFSAAAPLPLPLQRRWRERFGFPIYEGYGLTETSPLATYNHWREPRLGTVGTAVPGVELKVVDAAGGVVATGRVGEVCVRGPNVMAGYYGKAEETRRTVRGGWLYTGDVGRLDADGYLTIVDRIKDMINSGGLKIWPREVEEVIYTHPNVRECALVGVPHPDFGETPVACVVLHRAGQTRGEEIVTLCRRHLADYKAPRRVEFLPNLPKNPTGKVLKRQLRQQLAQPSPPLSLPR